MRRYAVAVLVMPMMLTIAACTKDANAPSSKGQDANVPPKQQAEALFKQMPAMMNALADSLEKAKDEQEAKDKAAEYFKTSMELNKKLVALNLPNAEREEIMEDNRHELEKAQKRMFAAGKKYPEALAIAEDGPLHEDGLVPAGAALPKVLHSWKGWLEKPPSLPSTITSDGVITDAKTFTETMAALRPGEKPPELDFGKVFAFVRLYPGGFLRPTAYMTPGKDGDLMASSLGSGFHVPGISYFLVVYDRQGIKTVNGNELKK
jgi:hypothetical protein